MLHLFEMLFPPREDEKVLRNISNDDFLSLVAPRLVGVTRPGTIVLLPFGNVSVRGAIHEAKYHGNDRAFRLLALAFGEYLHDYNDVEYRKRSIVPIPLGKARRLERGFNQTEEVARQTLHNMNKEERRLFILEPNLLLRTRETISQISLPRQKREENMRGAFLAMHPVDPSFTYVLLDDVLTTGATLQAAIDALQAAGARHIIPLALTH